MRMHISVYMILYQHNGKIKYLSSYIIFVSTFVWGGKENDVIWMRIKYNQDEKEDGYMHVMRKKIAKNYLVFAQS